MDDNMTLNHHLKKIHIICITKINKPFPHFEKEPTNNFLAGLTYNWYFFTNLMS